MPDVSSITSNLHVDVGGIRFETWQVLAIVGLLFLFLIVMASVRRHLLEYTIKGAGFGLLLGFILALVIEGFLLIGGKTVLIQTLGWKDAPKPIQKGIELARSHFVDVLGAQTQNPLETLKHLSEEELEEAKSLICTP